MNKINELKNKNKLNKIAFICNILISITVLAVFMLVQLLYDMSIFEGTYSCLYSDTAVAIVISLLLAFVTILSITLNMDKEMIYNIGISDIRKYGNNFKYQYLVLCVVVSIFVMVAGLCIVFNSVFTMFGLILSIVLFVIADFSIELPMILNKKDYAIKILIRKYLNCTFTDKGDESQKAKTPKNPNNTPSGAIINSRDDSVVDTNLNRFIICMIKDMGLTSAINKIIEINKDIYNNIDITHDVLSLYLSNLDNENVNDPASIPLNSILIELNGLMVQGNSMEVILKDDDYFKTRLYFQPLFNANDNLENNDIKLNTIVLLETMIRKLDSDDENAINFSIKIIINLLCETIPNSGMHYLNQVNEILNKKSFFNKYHTLLIDIISIYLYYLVNDSNNLSKYNKTLLNEWVTKNEYNLNRFRIINFSALYRKNTNKREYSYKLFKDIIKNTHSFAFEYYNEVHNVVFTDAYISKVFVQNRLIRGRVYSAFNVNNFYDDEIIHAINDIDSNTIFSDLRKGILEYYDVSEILFDYDYEFENYDLQWNRYINEIKREKRYPGLVDEKYICPKAFEEVQKDISNQIIAGVNKLNKSKLYDSSIDLTNEEIYPITFNWDKIDCNDQAAKFAEMSLLCSLSNDISNKISKFGKDYTVPDIDSFVDFIVKNRINNYTFSNPICKFIYSDQNYKLPIEFKAFDDSDFIFNNDIIFSDRAIRYNIEVLYVFVNELSSDDIDRIIAPYIDNKGRYSYGGVYFNREQITNLFKNKDCKIMIYYKFKTVVDTVYRIENRD